MRIVTFVVARKVSTSTQAGLSRDGGTESIWRLRAEASRFISAGEAESAASKKRSVVCNRGASWLVVVFCLLAILLFQTRQPALAQTVQEAEHIEGNCAYRHAATNYRFNAPAGLFMLSNDDRTRFTTAAGLWNAKGWAATTFQSAGVTGVPQRFRVYLRNDPALIYWGGWEWDGSCFRANWPDESRMFFNNATFVDLDHFQRISVMLHELGHAVGLGHHENNCINPFIPATVMARAQVMPADCGGGLTPLGPYTRDEAATDRIRNRTVFFYRNSLSSGGVLSLPWQTESDSRIFRGRPSLSSPADGPATYDVDKYREVIPNSFPPIAKQNSILFRSQGGIGQPNDVRFNMPVGAAWDKGSMLAGRLNIGQPDGLASFYNGQWRLSNGYHGNSLGTFWFGAPGDIPVLGDWNGDQMDTIGIFRPSTGQWHLRNINGGGAAQLVFYYGDPGDIPVFGNWWDPTGQHPAHEIGVVRGRTWYLRRTLDCCLADVQFNFPEAGAFTGMRPLLGDWDGNGQETPAFLR